MSGETDQKHYDVFICYYSKTGKLFARYLKNGLPDFNREAFLDVENIPKYVKRETDEWRSHIDDGIKNSDNFVLIMTLGFNKRREVLRELKQAFESNMKVYYFKYEHLDDEELIVEIDNEKRDLSESEYNIFCNDADLLTQVEERLRGKSRKKKFPLFESEAERLIASEGLEIKQTNEPFIEIVIGPKANSEEWLKPTLENQSLLSCNPYCSSNMYNMRVRRESFECESSINGAQLNFFWKVTTKGFFHSIEPFYRGQYHYIDSILIQILGMLLCCIRVMQFCNLKSDQSVLIILKNIRGREVIVFTPFQHGKFSFSNSKNEVRFHKEFNPDNSWKEIVKVFAEICRELCAEVSYIGITNDQIRSRLNKIVKSMADFRRPYNSGNIHLPLINLDDFGFLEK